MDDSRDQARASRGAISSGGVAVPGECRQRNAGKQADPPDRQRVADQALSSERPYHQQQRYQADERGPTCRGIQQIPAEVIEHQLRCAQPQDGSRSSHHFESQQAYAQQACSQQKDA